MSENSLLDTGNTPDEVTAEAPETPTAEADAPAIERPEWLQDKYVTEERTLEDSISEQAKAYVNAQKMLGGFTGAPDEYKFELPEGMDGEVDTELEAYTQFVELAKDKNINNETAQGLFEIFAKYQESMTRQTDVDRNAQIQELGAEGPKRLQAMSGWFNNNLSPDENEVVGTMTSTAQQIEVLEKIIGMTRNSSLPKANNLETAPSGYTMEDYKRDVQTDQYYSDAHFRESVKKKVAGIV